MNILILSIGSNPMPNFITAEYLLNSEREENELIQLPKPDKVLFIHSSKTESFKEYIENELKLDQGICCYVNLMSDERKFEAIKKRVIDELKKFEYINSIHLNYTGGTKVMAVAISEAVASLNNPNTIYSDLSPKSFQLSLRNGNVFPVSGDLRKYVKIKINQIYSMHGLKEPENKFELQCSNTEWYSKDSVNFMFQKIKDDKNGNEDFFDLWDNIKFKSSVKNIPEKILKDTPFEIESSQLNKKILKKFQHLQKFIRGTWLEEYVFDVLSEIKDECGLNDIAWNIEIKVKNRPFELDVIAVKGCQTFVFTCTTAYDIRMCKGKAFEGLYRAEQIGGGQAKTILVCLADNFDKKGNIAKNDSDKTLDNLRADLSQFDALQNFYVLGQEEIKDRNKFKLALKEILGE